MSYFKKIEKYEIVSHFNSPLKSNTNKTSTCGFGDELYVIDNEVWLRDLEKGEDEYTLANYTPEFVRNNPLIFQKQQY